MTDLCEGVCYSRLCLDFCLSYPKVPGEPLPLTPLSSQLFILDVFFYFFSITIADFYVFRCVPFGNLKHASIKLTFIKP